MKSPLQWSRGPQLILLLGLFLTAYLLLNATHLPLSIPAYRDANGGYTILNLLPFYDADTAYRYLQQLTPQAITIYRNIVLMDALWLIPAYTLLFSLGIRHASQWRSGGHSGRVWQSLSLLPWLAALLNYIEDAMILYLMQEFPQRHLALATLCGGLTTSKTLLLVISLCSCLGLYLSIALRRPRTSR
ncbi:hypothetical protein [Leeia aquatica]|uniref:Uncharacterized protein n=1 Tax=Leeia aquatica TaxID=2725557 RepID=A0A847SCQ8_9NEIS|nr:hypothetical protein [Leeia aquatica]NLR74938.1 hypothetical protein [Leeia aquatica]